MQRAATGELKHLYQHLCQYQTSVSNIYMHITKTQNT